MAELKISIALQNLIKKIVRDAYYPVGKIYITMGNENPNETIGGTWEKTAAGKVLVGVDTNDIDFNTIGKTGGDKAITLTVAQMPKHKHKITHRGWYGTTPGSGRTCMSNETISGDSPTPAFDCEEVGGTQAHNNVQPYMTVYMWKRTA